MLKLSDVFNNFPQSVEYDPVTKIATAKDIKLKFTRYIPQVSLDNWEYLVVEGLSKEPIYIKKFYPINEKALNKLGELLNFNIEEVRKLTNLYLKNLEPTQSDDKGFVVNFNSLILASVDNDYFTSKQNNNEIYPNNYRFIKDNNNLQVKISFHDQARESEKLSTNVRSEIPNFFKMNLKEQKNASERTLESLKSQYEKKRETIFPSLTSLKDAPNTFTYIPIRDDKQKTKKLPKIGLNTNKLNSNKMPKIKLDANIKPHSNAKEGEKINLPKIKLDTNIKPHSNAKEGEKINLPKIVKKGFNSKTGKGQLSNRLGKNLGDNFTLLNTRGK